jgi:DNA-binding CsgD family transcriptional regulator/tetratricopeptide (TPR) repeat protein
MRGGVRRAAVVVGREVELDQLVRAVHGAREGGSSCAFLVGEGGVGKTRLLAEVAAESRQLGLAVMAGRSPVATPVAFSVLAEALRSWLRANDGDRAMPPFDAGLRLVLPEWPGAATAGGLSDAQLRLLALEGVVRLVQDIAASTRGAVLLLDDLHAADPDSLEAIRYLAAASAKRVLIVGALRSREGMLPEQVVRSLQRDGVADVFDLEPLGRREVTELLGALLDAEPPRELVDDVVARTDGVPLLVEEVLDAHLRSGAIDLGERGARWRGGTVVVSRTVRDMVEARLERLSKRERDLVTAGAVLGDFEASLLALVAQQSVAAVGDAVAAATNAGVLETVGGSVDFRHALIREAVLEATLPHVLHALHRRAATALAERSMSEATTLERRAGHLEQIGEHGEAALLLTAAASRRLDEHALLSAEALARRALDLAIDPPERKAASDTLARALATQGRWTDALTLDETADRAHGEDPARRRRMAACAVEAAQPDLARVLIARAIEAGDESPHVHAIAGRLALAEGKADEALASAERALAAAEQADDIGARGAALDVLGRALDYAGRREEARRVWTRQAEEAEAAGLTEARMRAVVQLGKLEVFEGVEPDRLYEAVDLARAAGALVEQAWAEENLAIALIVQGDPTAGANILHDAIERCRDLRLDQLPYLLAALGGAESLRGAHSVASSLFDEAERLAPTADMAIHTYGIRADIALRAGRYAEGLDWYERCVKLIRSSPGGMPSDSPCWLVWALAAVDRADDAADALREARSFPDDLARWHGRPVLLAAGEALLNGDESGIDAAIASATGRMPFEIALMRVLGAEILAGPARVRWLREALEVYESHGMELESARVRRLLREAGGPVPRRRRTGGSVPEELAKEGVTFRETEVLRLVGEGLSNAVIAERLYLSIRTVETHVSSLLAKLHVESRGQLTALSAAITYESVESSTS